MARIDAHQHFWEYDPVRDSWITEDMSRIRANFSPDDLSPLLQKNNIVGCVAVQAEQSEAQNDYLLTLAEDCDFIKGIVGWIDLQADNVIERLEHYAAFDLMKGFRHVLQGEPQRDMMLNDAFRRGIGHLAKFNFTYDILIFPDQLKYSAQLVREFPDQSFVIDHLAKPYIKLGKIDEWRNDMEAIAQFQNVYCKVSGAVTEAHWKKWRKQDFQPYFDVVAESFGPDRLMFGSDWPVCLVAAEYDEVVDLVKNYFSSFSTDEQQKIFGENATRFYNLYI